MEFREVTSEKMRKESAKINGMLSRPMKSHGSSKIGLYVIRIMINRIYASIPKAQNIKFSRVKLGKTKAILAEPSEGTGSKDVILYIHGGAFLAGRAWACKGYASQLASHSGLRTYAIDYTLSPEVKYPVALNECLEAVNSIKTSEPDSKITIVGDSAGANLCLAIGLKMKEQISCVILNSPVIDFTDTIDRAKYNRESIVVKKGLKDLFQKVYTGGCDAKDPLISPFFGNFEGFPPTFVTCDQNEGLFADAKYVYEKCVEVGTRTRAIVMKGAFHAFAVMGDSAEETARILDDSLEFMREALK